MKSIIVVEGRDDTRRLKEVFGNQIDTIETQGSAISIETLELIKKAHEKRGAIVLTDPDYPGEKIRKTITAYVPTIQHAFISVDEGIPRKKGSLGVEHASDEALKKALSAAQHVVDHSKEVFTNQFLLTNQLIGLPDSKKLRDKLAQHLRIGHVNGKQLAKRLEMFGYTQHDVIEALQKVKGEFNE